MSRPDSTIVVHTSTSASPRRKSSIVVSSSFSSICPWATSTRASGTIARTRSAVSSIVSTRLCRKNTCPPRPSSRSIAASPAPRRRRPRRSSPGAGPPAASRSRRCRAARPATSAACAGSAWRDSESTSTFSRSWRSSSFCFTPKRCSSSTISRPRSLGRTSLHSRRCVPMRMSTCPSSKPVERLAALLRRAEARHHLDRERVVAQPLSERAEVLLGEHRGGHQEHHLLAVRRRLERRAQGDLGLAVAHVAADQAVHRPRLLHVGRARPRSPRAGRASRGTGTLASNSTCHSPSAGKAWPERRLRSA